MKELEAELEPVNTINRLALAMRTAPKAVSKVDTALSSEYVVSEDVLRAGELGLRTLKALDPKLRTQTVDIKHSGNVLLTIQNVFRGLSEAIEANYEVLDQKPEKDVPGAANAQMGSSNISSKPENVQPGASGEVDLALDKDKS